MAVFRSSVNKTNCQRLIVLSPTPMWNTVRLIRHTVKKKKKVSNRVLLCSADIQLWRLIFIYLFFVAFFFFFLPSTSQCSSSNRDNIASVLYPSQFYFLITSCTVQIIYWCLSVHRFFSFVFTRGESWVNVTWVTAKNNTEFLKVGLTHHTLILTQNLSLSTKYFCLSSSMTLF